MAHAAVMANSGSGGGDVDAPKPLARISLRRQLGAVMRKNWILVRRNPRDLVREWLIPIALMLVLVLMRASLKPTTTPEVPHHDIDSVMPLGLIAGDRMVYFAPCATQDMSDNVFAFARRFANATGVTTKCFECDAPTASCSGDDSLQATAVQDMDNVLAGVVFAKPSTLTATAAAAKPATVAYTIRMDNDELPGVGTYNTSRTSFGPDSTAGEFKFVFLPLQHAIDQTIAAATTGAPNPTMFYRVRQFPFPQFTVDIGTQVLGNIIPIYFLLVFSLQVRVLVYRILEEKQKRIKEGMKMMGLNDVVFFLSWLLTAGAKGAIVVVTMTVVCKVGQLFEYSSVLLVLVWFLSFLLVCIAYTFIITTFFDQARTGGVVGMLLYLALFLPSLALRMSSVPRALQLISCLLAPTSFALGNGIFNDAEANQVGIQFSNLFQTSTVGISMGECLVMLWIDAVIYSVLAWYFDRVIPSEYGTHSEPLFCCRRRFWCARTAQQRSIASPLLEVEGNNTAIEPVPPEMEENRAVTIAGLCKTFSTKEGPKKAVDHLHLTMYKGHITCLLGHNGAGKTTTISMLTGLIPSTDGDATVFGRSIVDDIQGVRELTGVCPQYDILFDKLTVLEHLQLYGGIKGLPPNVLETQVKEMIRELGLGEKMNAMASTLSGGQKRRLSVAMALMGDPKVVFLDEPTSGLDPAARRHVWSVLERYKKGRVIVLCTHFMEEADILGDRIAVMAHGSLRVVGSSLYLKNRFGLGYHLTMSVHEDADVRPITDMVRQHVPLAQEEEDIASGAIQASAAANRGVAESKAESKASGDDAHGDGSEPDTDSPSALCKEIAYTLPMTAAPSFAPLFHALEEQQGVLRVQNYGLSMTTLEEVFLRLAEVVEQEQLEQQARDRQARPDDLPPSRRSKRSMDLSKLGGARGSRRMSGRLDAADVAVDMNAEPAPKPGRPYAKLEDVGSSTPTPTAFDTFQDLKPSVGRHLKATVWRLARAARRDKRGLFLQMIMPCLFVGISSVFRSIASATTAQSFTVTPMNPTQWTSLPANRVSMPFAYGNQTLAEAVTSFMPPAAPSTTGMPPLSLVSASSITPDALDTYLIDHQYQSGALYFGNTATILEYNTSLTNWLPIALNLVNNAVLRWSRQQAGFADNTDPVAVSYDPFPLTASERKPSVAEFVSAGLIGYYIALGFSAIPGLIALRVVKEKEVKAKQQQFVMGMKPVSYYLGNLLWDSLQYLVPAAFSCVIFYVFGTAAMRRGENFVALALILVLSGPANASFVYAFSFLFSSHTSAQTFTMLMAYLGTTVTFFAGFILSLPSVDLPSIIAQIANYIFLLFPNYAVARGFMDVNLKASCLAYGGPSPLCTPPSPWAWDIAGQKLAYLLATTALWMVVTLLLERATRPSATPAGAKPFNMQEGAQYEDDDVRAERTRVDGGRANGENVVVRHLRKVFPARENNPAKVAVADLTIGCREGECFGLLGPNGAGKTTALSMLTADLSPSFGAATVHGRDIFAERDEVYRMMGYCPQFDALFDLLTGEECLRFYATIKGVPEEDIPAFVQRSLERMDLTRYQNEITKNYSGGNKRKLSLSIAFVGAPRTVFLDEPSTGMDPVARRHMWNVVSSSRAGRTIFLTTHLLEEADVLSSKIGILVNGRLACLGTPQRLKSLYGAGYRMEIKTKDPRHERALDEMVLTFAPDMRVLERHRGHVNYELGRDVSLARVFETIEEARERLEIQDYAVSQTSLEQVFLGFAKRQAENFDL